MKHLFYSAFLLLCFSCTNTATSNREPGHSDTATSIASPGPAAAQAKSRMICWRGTLDSKIDILLQYQVEGEVVEGELIYLNTKAKEPIKIIGTIEEDQSLRLLEFEPSGNITGILIGTPTASVFEGSWFSPLTRKDLPMQLRRVDTFIATQSITALPASPEGDYYYQYGKEGNQGTLLIRSINNSRVLFEIASVTGAPARNIAYVSPDTITLQGNSFIYTVPETDDCTFKVSFYKDFAYIQYTNGYCNGVFGHNASVDGIFYKQP